MNDNVIEIGKILVIFIFIPKDIEIRVNLSIRSFFFTAAVMLVFAILTLQIIIQFNHVLLMEKDYPKRLVYPL